MNITISNPRASYYLGGTEVVSLFQALYLARRGHSIRYYVRQVEQESEYFTDFLAQIKNVSVEIIRVPLDETVAYGDGTWPKWYAEAFAYGVAAQPFYVKETSDIFVTHLQADGIFSPKAIPSILHLHGNPLETDALIDASMTLPKHTIAHSQSIHDWWHSHYPKLPMDIFRNGVETDAFYADVSATRPIDILYVGRFLEHKGIDDILEVIEQQTHVVIAGHGPFEQAIRDKITARGLTNVEVIIRPDNETLKNLYKTSKIFACPSRSKEGVLTTMLEAGAAGCAIVTASGSGMTDLAQDTINSRVITPGDREALKEICTTLLGNETERQRLATAIQTDICRDWSWDTKAKELEELYTNASN